MKYFIGDTSWGYLIGSAGILIEAANFIVA